MLVSVKSDLRSLLASINPHEPQRRFDSGSRGNTGKPCGSSVAVVDQHGDRGDVGADDAFMAVAIGGERAQSHARGWNLQDVLMIYR